MECSDERRNQKRHTVSISGLVRSRTGIDAQVAMISNISRTGFLLETHKKLALGELIEFEAQGLALSGKVIHYQQQEKKSVAGIELERPLDETELGRLLQ
jgi:hypothetical protein